MDSHQFKWLTVSWSSAWGLVSLPAKIRDFFLSQARLRCNALVRRDLVRHVRPRREGLRGRKADEGRPHRRCHEIELFIGRRTEDLLDRLKNGIPADETYSQNQNPQTSLWRGATRASPSSIALQCIPIGKILSLTVPWASL